MVAAARARSSKLLVAALIVALSVLALASAAPASPTTPILDDFDGRGLEDPLYQWGNWATTSIDGSGPTFEILGGVAGHNEGDAVPGDSFRVANVTGSAEAHATIAGAPENNENLYLYINLQQAGTTGWDGYRARWFHWITTDGLYLEKIVDGVATSMVAPLEIEPAVGDGIMIRNNGGSIELWHKTGETWHLRLSASDGSFTGGKIGLGSSDDSGAWDSFGGSGEITPPPTPPEVPATGFLDQFERANEDPLSQGGAWSSTSVFGAGQTLEVLGNAAGQNEASFIAADSFRTDEITGDAEVHARIAAMPDNNQDFYLYLHLQQAGTAGVDGYAARWFHWIQPDGVYIQKIVDGVATTIAGPLAIDPAVGNTLLLRRFGLTLELWRKNAGTWTKLLSTIDGTYMSGRLGLGENDEDGRWDDFGGGAIVPPPTGPPPGQTFGAGQGGRMMNARCGCLAFADPVSSRTGAFTTTADDLGLPGAGVSFAWSRSYTSADTTVGRLGPGWVDSYAASLTVQANGDVLLRGEDGQQLEYTNAGGGSFTGAPGALSTLEAVTAGYELTRTDQVVSRFDAGGRLLSVKDRHEQGVTLGYDAQNRLETITDSANRQATVSYNAENLVSEVESADGRSVAYGYTAGRLTSVTDVRGKTWTYTYDAGGRLESIVDPLGHAEVTNVYGTDGRVGSQTDALGKETTFTWNAQTETATAIDANDNVWTHDYENGILVTEADPLQHETGITPDHDFNAEAVTGPTGETTEMTYDEAGNVLTATAPPSLGSVQKTFQYNARNDVELVTDARGKITDYEYDPATGDLTSVTHDGVAVGSYTYDAAGRAETYTDGNEKTWTYTYFPVTGYLESSTDPLGNKSTYTYDPAGRLLTRVDPKGNVAGCDCAADFTWSYTYDAAGNQLTETNPLGHTTTNVYDDAGRLTSTTDALGRTTSYTYDDANRVLTKTAPDPDGGGQQTAPVTSYTYDDAGNRLTESDPRGNTTTFVYDDANRLVSTTEPDPDGAGPLPAPVTTQTYDPNGNLASTVEPRGNVQGANPNDFRTTFTYDAAGRMLTEASPDPDGAGPKTPSVTTDEYDAVGNLVSVTDAKSHETSYTYDAAGRILTVIGPDGGLTTYTYDDSGNVLTRTDDNSHMTTFAYDDAGRLASETSPDPDGPGPHGPAVTTYTYDANGNQLTVTDPNGNATPTAGDGVTSYGYDRANRQTSIDYSDSTPDVTFTNDAAGNQLTMSDGSGTETRTYDNLDRVLTVTRGSDTFSYAYDAASNVTRRTYPGGTDAFYAYDPLNRLQSLSTSSNPAPSNTTSYAYDAASNLVQATLPSGNGYVESRVYDRAARLTEVTNQRGSTILSRFLSDLDPAGNPLQVVRTGALNQTQTHTYDANDRITGVCFQAGTCPGGADPFIRWTYDKVGNRLTEQRPTGTTSYTNDARDRLLQAGSTTFAYDQNGNQTQKGSRTFAYDLANRLQSTTEGSTTTGYTYDGASRRVEASGDGTSAGPTLRTDRPTEIGTSGTAIVAKPTGTVAGDLLIVGLAFEKGWDVAITPPPGWTLIRRTNQSSNVGYATYRKLAGASEPSSYAFALTNSPKWSIGACAVVGAHATTPIDVHADATGVNGNPTAPTITTTAANRLVLAFYANKKSASYSSYTAPAVERWDRPNTSGGLPSNAMASYEQAAAGATGAKTATVGEQAEWVAQQIAITPAPPGTTTTRFLWDTNHSLPQLALERDASGSLLRRYLHGNDLTSMHTPTGSSYYHTDGLGSVTNLTDAAGATQWTYSWEPFGTARTQTQDAPTAPGNPMRFTGEYEDPIGLYHLRARQYDTATGRFVGVDPVQPALEEPHTSTYVYAGAQPTAMVDPSGESKLSVDSVNVSRSASSSSTPGLDRARVVWYLLRWAKDTNPHFGRARSFLHGEVDCTNFISQALLVGGWQENETWHFKRSLQCIPNVSPYFPTARCSMRPDPSVAWINVKAFIAFAVSSGRAVLSRNMSRAQRGDVVVADWQGGKQVAKGADHLFGITGLRRSQILVSSHGKDRRNFALYDHDRRENSVEKLEPRSSFALLHMR